MHTFTLPFKTDSIGMNLRRIGLLSMCGTILDLSDAVLFCEGQCQYDISFINLV